MENTAPQTFNSSFISTPPRSEAEQFLDKMKIDYERKPDGTLVVHGSVDLSKENPAKMPDFSSAMIMGDFTCGGAAMGRSLKGAPKAVVGNFKCDNMGLTSLEGAPEMVWGNFSCVGNNLASLAHSPKFVEGDFHCQHNGLTTLAGAPKEVGGGFYCQHNELESLAGAPRTVGKDFFCYDNAVSLTDLDHLPQVGGRVHTGEHVFEKGETPVIPTKTSAPSIAPSQVTPPDTSLISNDDDRPTPAASKFTSPDRIAALLNAHNLKNIDRNIVKIRDVSADPVQGLLLHLEGQRTLHLGKKPDGGDFIGLPAAAPKMERDDAAAIISLGKSRGWTDIQLQGSDRDKTLLCLEAEKQGVTVANPPPQDVMAKLRKEFEVEAQAPTPQRVASKAGAPRI